MEFDVLLPTLVFLIVAITVSLYQKIKDKISTLFEDRKFSTRDALLLVISMGLMGTAIALAPSQAIQILYIATYSYMMFFFTYMALKRWYIAIFPPIIFILLYFLYWNFFIFNLFASVFAIIITVYIGGLFSWKTTWIFAILLTIMDVYLVFVTGVMGESATKTLELRLPVAVILPTYPSVGVIGLGLGDIFLSGLLSIQTALKHGQKAGILTAITISIAMFLFEVTLFNVTSFEFFPATVVVILGWIAGVGIIRMIHLIYQPFHNHAEKTSE